MPVRRSLLPFLAAAVAAPLLAACGAAPDGASVAARPGCVEDHREGVDHFPDKITLEDAAGFSVEYHDHYQVLTVAQPFEGADPQSYVLVRCGTPDPELDGPLADAPRITVPVSSIYSASTTHLPAITSLGRLEALTGVDDGAFVSSGDVIARIEAGDVAEYAKGGSIDVEHVVAAAPDVLVTGGTENPEYDLLRTAGVTVVANSEWLESTPLARAEWIKFFAALTGTEARAQDVYADIKQRYEDVAALVADVAPVPVLPGSAYQGTWYVPSGGGYVGRLLADAGGTYPWADHGSTGSLGLDMESVVGAAADIPTWLLNDTTVTTVGDLLGQDDRYSAFAAARDGQVWNATKKLGPGGGNDYWESGVQRPDLILSDLVAILHPELLPDHVTVYYQPIHRD